MEYEFAFGEILRDWDLLARGIRLTAALWVIAFVTALAAGLFLGIARMSPRRALNWPATAYIEIFRNTPVLVQLVWFYYAFPVLTGVQVSPFVAASLGLCLNTSAYCAEIYRAGLQSIVAGQWEAGRALGMSEATLMRRIILPQALRRMLPAFTNRAVELAKMTSIASVITVHELMHEARTMATQSFLPLETFTVVAAIYFILIYPGTLGALLLERRLATRGGAA
ncbi:amino acid ABC transporter permease [Roseomonas stagni]|uniref:Glutamate/aspartate import permease protein GltK n=1 Tax=Falsiroseomonas algicola TaxID=2716930 RepID=A0A6M1LVE5_9PROT|nr:amino acid ABC transporter permease [Falsiroseomonas algicola]NGM24009.1 amino acid ABC transporter permease [Falsiroseomonas algicola]